MILLDTDHLSVLRYVADRRHARLKEHILAALSSEDVATTIITITRNALLLSANLSDFSRIPGLKVEDWLGA